MKYTLKNILCLLKKKPVWNLEEGHVVTPAFISGGRQYYELKNPLSIFTFRGLEAFFTHDEWGMRMTGATLDKFIDAMEKSINDAIAKSKEGTISLTPLYELIIRMKERRRWVIPTQELIFKMGGIIYFDDSESPYEYDEPYAREKIARWKKEGVDPFFFAKRMPHSIPLQGMLMEDFMGTIRTMTAMEEMQEALLMSHLQGGSENQESRPTSHRSKSANTSGSKAPAFRS